MHLPRFIFLICCASYYWILQLSYRWIEGVEFTELGLVIRPPSVGVECIAFVLAMVPGLVLPTQVRRPSSVALIGLYLTLIAPFCFVSHHVLGGDPFQICVFTGFLITVFCGLVMYCNQPTWKLPSIHLQTDSMVTGIIVLNFALILIVSGTAGFHYDLSFESHYDRRMVARDVVSGGSLQAYSIATLAGAVAPLLVSIGYLWHRPLTFGSGVLGLLTIFAFSGTKTELFTPLLLAGVYGLLSLDERKRGSAAILAGAGLVFASLVQYYFFERLEISLYFCRRTLFVPALLTSIYWDFFSVNPNVYYSDSFLRWALQSPYDLPMARTIGVTYFGSHEANANANIWASAFGHMGYLGIVFTSSVFGVLLRGIDSVAVTGDSRLACMMTALFALVWSNGALETSMLTNGVGVSILLLWSVSGRSHHKPSHAGLGQNFDATGISCAKVAA